MNTQKAKALGILNDHQLKFMLNNQLFGDEGSTETDDEGETETNDSSNDDDTGGNQEAETFTQDDVDKVVQKRIARERKKWENEQKEKQTEAEKLSGMNDKQKQEYQDKKKQEDLTKREQEITRRELKAEAKITLADKNLPVSLADVLDYADADACNTSIEVVEKAFQEAVQKAIDDKIKGGEVIKKAKGNTAEAESKAVYNSMMGK